jgi:hypothetical protein
VADDSRDLFFEIDKPTYFGFQIVTINYEENFTKAKAVVAVDVDWKHPRIGKLRVKQPVTSTWKLENGQWWWYMVPLTEHQTAFGVMKPGPDNEKSSPIMDAFKGVSVGDVLKGVQISARELRLKSHEASTAEVKIKNGLPGKVSLKVSTTSLKGLEATLRDTELDSGKETVLVVSHNPVDRLPKPRMTITLNVEQTKQALPINVIFELAPEHEKLAPRTR